MTLELRRLELGDLDAIEEIERVSYRTPWSRSMFTSELAKPSSLSLAALDGDGTLVGYLVLSKHVDAWHVMNVAVAPEHHERDASPFERSVSVTSQFDRRGVVSGCERILSDSDIAPPSVHPSQVRRWEALD